MATVIVVIIVSTIISAIIIIFIVIIVVVFIFFVLVIIIVITFLGYEVIDIWVPQSMPFKKIFYVGAPFAELVISVSKPAFITSRALSLHLPFVANISFVLFWVIYTDALLMNLGIIGVGLLDRLFVFPRYFLEFIIVNSIIYGSFRFLFLLNRI